jgi:pimeloyl-ACP methyl ester carboxylesterase
LQLHYIKTRPELRKRPARHLVIFIHGFPDSCHLFRKVLESDLSADAQFVSLDLPGCGGSDSLPKYSSDLVLNAVVDAIVLLKRQYLTRDGMKCILVAHDWGGVVGYRIAADTRGLFDRMITMNGVYVRHLWSFSVTHPADPSMSGNQRRS